MTNEEIKKEFEELESYSDTVSSKQDRGRRFEQLIIEYLKNEPNVKIVKGPSLTTDKSEQIDGVIKINSRIFLLEMKWVESGLAASDLYAFVGKVDNKLYGTLGLFISKEALSDRFKNSLSKGRQQKVLILEADDVKNLFEIEGRFAEYIEASIEQLSSDNKNQYSVSSFIELEKCNRELKDAQNKMKIANQQMENAAEVLNDYINFITNGNLVDEFLVREHSLGLSLSGKRKIFEFILENIGRYYELYSYGSNYAYVNIENAVKCFGLFDESNFKIYYKNLILYKSLGYFTFLWKGFEKYLGERITEIVEVIAELFEKYNGVYEAENILTNCIKSLYDDIPDEMKVKFVVFYIEFYFSSRKDGYPQKDFARRLLSDENIKANKKLYDAAANQYIGNKIEQDVRSLQRFDYNEKKIERSAQIFCNNYYEFVELFNYSEDKLKDVYRRKVTKKFKTQS